MPDYSQEELGGAIALLVKCLGLQTGETVAIFFDEGSEDVAELISGATSKVGLSTLKRMVPLLNQTSFSKNEELSLEDLSALSNAIGIITCLDDTSDGVAYRRALLQHGASGGRRLAHMPGARRFMFRDMIDVDYAPILQMCDDLALAMATGSSATLRTYELNDFGHPIEERELKFSIGRMNRLPVVSTGLISPGTWGNVPGAETFIAPIEGSASGKYVINGSFTDCVITGNSRIVLTFSDGRLVDFVGTPDLLPRFTAFIHNLYLIARSKTLELAEFGIGTNPSIRHLVGKSLVDEKCLGTAHIAIGGNRGYGGQLDAPVHEDFVTRTPSLTIDGKFLLHHGEHTFRPQEWRDNVGFVEPTPEFLNRAHYVRKTFANAEVSNGSLRFRRMFGADRLCRYTVGDPNTTMLLADVYRRVPNLPGLISVAELGHITGLDIRLLAALLTILERHQLVEGKR